MSIDYSIKAIPTRYRGVWYRSRLEAKWAAFFDRCSWAFTYEPADLGAWSPDFSVLTGNRGADLVEVKPISSFDYRTSSRMLTSAKRAGFNGMLLKLGVAPTMRSFGYQIGWTCAVGGSSQFSRLPEEWASAVLHQNDNYEPIGICQIFPSDDVVPTDLCSGLGEEYWNEASNSVQWKSGSAER